MSPTNFPKKQLHRLSDSKETGHNSGFGDMDIVSIYIESLQNCQSKGLVKVGTAAFNQSIVIDGINGSALDAHAGNTQLGLQGNGARGVDHLVLGLCVARDPKQEEGLAALAQAFHVIHVEEDVAAVIVGEELGNILVRSGGFCDSVELNLHFGLGRNIHLVDDRTEGRALLEGFKGSVYSVGQSNNTEHFE